MPNVVNSMEVAHLWAHQAQAHARNSGSTLKFDGKTIYSYGHHFPISTFVQDMRGEEVVLFTTRTYGVTTAKHCGYVRNAIPRHYLESGSVFHVPLAGNEWHRDVLHPDRMQVYVQSYRERIDELGAKFAGARKPELYIGALQGLINEANAFCERFGQVDRFNLPDEEVVRGIREREREARASERERERERQERIEAENREKVQRWGEGENLWLPAGLKRTYLRVVGVEVQTSKGARFGVQSAMRGLALVRAVRARGEEWKKNGQTCKLGPYEVDKISAGGDVWAGCHHVEWTEIERVSGDIERAYEAMKGRGEEGKGEEVESNA